jgi:hypothetical protein
MIGGTDVTLTTRAGDLALEAAVRVIRTVWRSARYEDADGGRQYDRFSEIPFGELDELFVYRDHQAREAWELRGAVPENRNTMVHLLTDPGQITIVVDERDAEMNALIDAIRSCLCDNLFSVKAAA